MGHQEKYIYIFKPQLFIIGLTFMPAPTKRKRPILGRSLLRGPVNRALRKRFVTERALNRTRAEMDAIRAGPGVTGAETDRFVQLARQAANLQEASRKAHTNVTAKTLQRSGQYVTFSKRGPIDLLPKRPGSEGEIVAQRSIFNNARGPLRVALAGKEARKRLKRMRGY